MKNEDFQQLNIIYVERDKAWSLCPRHNDVNRPNLSISLLDRYYGRYTCWACGKMSGVLTKEQMGKLNLVDSVPHKNHRGSLLTRWKPFAESCYDNLQKFPLLKLGLAKQLNVGTESLDDWLVGYNGDVFTIPMFREDLREYNLDNGFCGVQKRFSDGTKRCVSGSRLGLMYSPYNLMGSTIFICEGFSDGISVWDLGLNSISRPHCRHTEGIADLLQDIADTAIIIPDSDAVGMEGAGKLQLILEKNGYDCAIFHFDEAKDIRQLIQLKGKDYVKKELEKYL